MFQELAFGDSMQQLQASCPCILCSVTVFPDPYGSAFFYRDLAGLPSVEDLSTTASPEEKSFTRSVRLPDGGEKSDASGFCALRRSDSPEIPLQVVTGPLDGADSSSGSSFVGLRVVAKWSSNGYFYSGMITQDVGAGKYKLLFDDGYECDVLGKDILLCDPIPLETEVTALSEDEYFSAGKSSA